MLMPHYGSSILFKLASFSANRCGKVCLLLAGFVLLLSKTAVAEDLRAYTERFPPFNFQLENGEPTGISYDLLHLIAGKAKLNIKTEFLPWQRAVKNNLEDPNSILFTTVRTPQREANFLWVGPIDSCSLALLKLKSRRDIQLKTVNDAYQYKIGLPATGADIEALTRLGFPAARLLKVPPSGNLIKMLYAGRFDLTSGILLSYAHDAKKEGLNPDDLAVAYTLQPGQGCYFAFNPKVQPELYQRFLQAYEALVQDGTLVKLQAKYLH